MADVNAANGLDAGEWVTSHSQGYHDDMKISDSPRENAGNGLDADARVTSHTKGKNADKNYKHRRKRMRKWLGKFFEAWKTCSSKGAVKEEPTIKTTCSSMGAVKEEPTIRAGSGINVEHFFIGDCEVAKGAKYAVCGGKVPLLNCKGVGLSL